MDIVEEIVLNKINQVLSGRTVAIYVPERLLQDFSREVSKHDISEQFLKLRQLRISGESSEHYSVCTIINASEIEDKRIINELKMLPATLNGKQGIYEIIEI